MIGRALLRERTRHYHRLLLRPPGNTAATKAACPQILDNMMTASSTREVRYFNSSRTVLLSSSSSEEPFYGSPRPVTPPLSLHNPLDRWQLLLQHAVTALRDPTRADAVAAVGELTGTTALRRLQDVMRQEATGRAILRDRPRVAKAAIPDYERLIKEAREMQKNNNNQNEKSNSITFGQAYGSFLLQHGFDPDERDEIRFMPTSGNGDNTADDDELAYILLRYRQSHDFFHTLTGLPPTVLGELALKWLELFQTGLPLAAFSATIGSAVTLQTSSEQAILMQHYLPWAMRVGRQMPFGTLLCVYYEQEWDTPLEELRARLHLEPVPPVVLGTAKE